MEGIFNCAQQSYKKKKSYIGIAWRIGGGDKGHWVIGASSHFLRIHILNFSHPILLSLPLSSHYHCPHTLSPILTNSSSSCPFRTHTLSVPVPFPPNRQKFISRCDNKTQFLCVTELIENVVFYSSILRPFLRGSLPLFLCLSLYIRIRAMCSQKQWWKAVCLRRWVTQGSSSSKLP